MLQSRSLSFPTLPPKMKKKLFYIQRLHQKQEVHIWPITKKVRKYNQY